MALGLRETHEANQCSANAPREQALQHPACAIVNLVAHTNTWEGYALVPSEAAWIESTTHHSPMR